MNIPINALPDIITRWDITSPGSWHSHTVKAYQIPALKRVWCNSGEVSIINLEVCLETDNSQIGWLPCPVCLSL